MVRGVLLGIGAFSLLVGLWLLVPEMLARGGSPKAYQAAARIAAVRSDLYAKSAELRAGDGAASNAARAVRLSPLLPHQWLLIAEAFAAAPDKHDPEGALTMAFFTGPGQRTDARPRLALASTALRLGNPELCDLLRSDIDYLGREGKSGSSPSVVSEIVAKAPIVNRTCLARLTGTPL
jgi:hypothetical protein